MSASIYIRPYAPADWPALVRIHDSARQIELALTVGPEAFLGLAETADNEGLFVGALSVAELAAEVAGFLALSESEVTWLYVDPEHARKGVGRALLRHALRSGDGPFETSVLEGNQPALALYLSEGFEIAETREGRLQGLETIPARGHILKRK